MADNITTQSATLASAPASEVFAFDECSIGAITVKVCRNKLGHGTDGSYTEVSTASGLPVQLQSGAVFTVQPGNTANTTAWLVTGTGGTFPVTDSGGSLTIDNATLSVVGGGVEATALRVTIASDSTGVLSVDDNGGSLTVDGTVATTQSGTWTIQPGNTANTTAWLVTGTGGTFPVTDSGGSLTVDAPVGTPVFVRLSDGAAAISTLPVSLASVPSHAVTNAGTFVVQIDGAALTALQLLDNLVLAEDAAHQTGDPGVQTLAVRSDTPANRSGADGDYEPLQMAAGRLWVDASGVTLTVGSHAVTNAGTFAVQAAQSGTWTVQPGNTANTTAWLMTGTGGTFPVTDSGGSLTVDAPVGTPVFVRLSDGASAITTLPVSLASVPSHAVTNAGTFVVQIDGAALTALQLLDNLVLAEDAAHQTGDPGVQSLAVRSDTPANRSGSDGDYEPLQMAGGRLWASATIDAALPAGANAIGKLAANSGVDIGDVDVTSLPNVTLAAGTNTNEVVGDAAEDAVLAGNPVRTGVRASAAEPTAMSGDGDVVTPWGDRRGRQVVKQQCGTGTTTQVADTASSTTILAANTSRVGVSIQNDSSAVLYIKCGTTASATDYTARLVQYSYWEAPYGYSGRVDGLWATDPGDGAARVTEYT